jgi:voltage-gated potassium channel
MTPQVSAPLSDSAPRLPGRRPPSSTQPGRFRFSAASYLAALLTLFCLSPFFEFRDGDLLEAVVLTLVLTTGVLAIGHRRQSLIFGVVLVLPALVAKWVNHLHPGVLNPAFFLAPGAIFVCFVVVQLLLFILRSPRVNAEVLCAGIAGYLTLGLMWVFAYLVVADLIPGAFSVPAGSQLDRFSALYFSIITLTTTGYGDITPVAGIARMLAMMEAITGTFYVAVLISRLVALYSVSTNTADTQDNPPSQPIL